MAKVDIDQPSYNVMTTISALLAIRRRKIKDNSLLQNGYQDHFGGTYEITNPTRSHTEAILTGAPAPTGNAKVDQMNLEQKGANLVSIREMALIYDLETDIQFPYIRQVAQLTRDIGQWLIDEKQKRDFDLNYMLVLDKENDIFPKVERLHEALGPLSNVLRMRSEGRTDTMTIANALRVDPKMFGKGLVEEGLSISTANDRLGADDTFRF